MRASSKVFDQFSVFESTMEDNCSLRRGQRTRAKPSWMEDPASICSRKDTPPQESGTQGSTVGSTQNKKPAHRRSIQSKPMSAAKLVDPLAKRGKPRIQINGRLLSTGECWGCHLEKTIRAGAIRSTRPKGAHVRCPELICGASIHGPVRTHTRIRVSPGMLEGWHAKCAPHARYRVSRDGVAVLQGQRMERRQAAEWYASRLF